MTSIELTNALAGLPNLLVQTYPDGMVVVSIMDNTEKTLQAVWLQLSSINDVRTTDRGTIYIYGKNGPLAAFHKDLLALAGGAR